MELQNERSREFAFEALRKPDLIRWGIFMPTMKQTLTMIQTDAPGKYYSLAYENVSERDLLYPIPAHEIILNKALIQNPGW
ncbi:SusD family protein [compost metagenome]